MVSTRLARALRFLAFVAPAAGCSDGRGDAAPAHQTAPFVFTAAGDYGFGDDAAATLDLIGRSGAHLHVALGDLSYSSTTDEALWCDFVHGRVGADFPFLLVPGNHEDDFGGDGHVTRFAECLPDRVGASGSYPEQYYFDHGGLARFILISPGLTVGGVHYFYGRDNEHYRWVADAIDGARRDGIPWVVVGMHKNCISLGPRYCDIYQELFSLLIDRKVDLVLHAHEHNYQRSRQLATGLACREVTVDRFDPACVAADGGDGVYVRGAGTVFVIVGTGGAALYEVDEDDAEAGYFAAWMGANRDPRMGFLRLAVSDSAMAGEFVGSTATSDFGDRFVIRNRRDGTGSPPGATAPPPATTRGPSGPTRRR